MSQGGTAGRLVSLNVGVPRDVAWEGRTVRTAIWKAPVDGPRMVRRINIDGDDQADRLAHGGEHRAVYVYQLASYRHWERALGRDDFVMGQFGENLTVEGLPDDEVCIGDRLRIGGALFEVTQPRVTCFRLGIRMGDPAMPALLVAHGRPGFYMRVLEEGIVEAGQAIEKVADGPQRLTVAAVDGLLYLPHRPRALLERALRVPAMSAGWRESFRDLLARADGAADAAPAWTGFRPLPVEAVRRESTSVSSFRLGPAGGDAPAPTAAPGQYVSVRVPAGPEGAALVRSYSLSDVPGPDGYRISVKREGIVSAHLHDRLAAGDVLDVAAPRGGFVLRPGTRPVALISAGVGATPVLAMLHALVAEGGDRPVWWIHGARNRAEHPFAGEVDALLARCRAGRRLVAYSRPGEGDVPGVHYDVAGRLGAEALDRAGVPVDADHYVCGPGGFMADVGAALAARGVPPDRVATEAFGAVPVHPSGIVPGDVRAPHQPAGPPGAGPAVTFARSGLTAAWDDRYPSILDFAEACDVPSGFGCRQGVCHACEAGLVDGEVDDRITPLEAPPEGRVLLCCTRPATALTLDL